jgi:hypothetical protein
MSYRQKPENKTNPVEAYTTVTLRNASNEFVVTKIELQSANFYHGPEKADAQEYLIIGFDTEFKTPENPLSLEEVRVGQAKYKVLSYQVYCSLYDPAQPDAKPWSGICYPNGDDRLSLSDILIFALSKGVNDGCLKTIPKRIYVAGHFTRADFPALSDFQNLSDQISAVRATFLSIKEGINYMLAFEDCTFAKIEVVLRDTMLLTPATSKSLKALGELVGLEKIVIDPDPERDQFYKINMDALLAENPELFERYAINDAEICTRYLEQLIDQCEEITGARMVPPTLTSIGVNLLTESWKDQNFKPLELLGQENIKERYFSKAKNRYVMVTKKVNMQEVDWHMAFATECYHGGRNEQFWFGPAFEDDWTDYDLSSAYPTAMALIGKPNWRELYTSTDVSEFTPETLGLARVYFKFPEHVAYPTLPVRTANGLVFPREGVSDCASPEIALAVSLGAEVKVRHGVIVPTDNETPIFGPFIKDCIAKRASYPKNSLSALFWKELSNSSYGKTAQGLRAKRVFDLRDREMKPLPPSKITQPFFASYITSFVRAVLGEIMNALPLEVCVFSCTTDGFLTNATSDHIEAASQGQLCTLFQQSRKMLTGDPTILEVKHQVRQPLGWRTRGQATLQPGRSEKGDSVNIVLAKGGIYTPGYLQDDRSRNDFITTMFFNRKPDDEIELLIKTGVKDIIFFDADLVEKRTSKRLNMEFDWKRMPVAAWQDAGTGHVAFASKAWNTIDEFIKMREYWESFAIVEPRCLKSVEDYRELAVYVLSQSSLAPEDARYLRKSKPDISRLRQMLCMAWKTSKAGLSRSTDGKSAAEFSYRLSQAGIPCKRTDVENAKKDFVPNICPDTPDVREALEKLEAYFPDLIVDEIVVNRGAIDLLSALDSPLKYQSIYGKAPSH